jgi:hypothetical protein
MIITEPTTLLTDYAIAVEACVLAVFLLRIGRVRQQLAPQLWAAAFSFVAAAAVLGGTCHGFMGLLELDLLQTLWRTLTYCLSFASFFMLAATVLSALPRRLRLWALLAVGLRSSVHLGWAINHTSFSAAVGDYLSAMLIVLILQIRIIDRDQNPSAIWIIAGILVSCLAIGIQASGFSLAKTFNHNDLYHLVQMGGLYLFYRGARLLKDR